VTGRRVRQEIQAGDPGRRSRQEIQEIAERQKGQEIQGSGRSGCAMANAVPRPVRLSTALAMALPRKNRFLDLLRFLPSC